MIKNKKFGKILEEKQKQGKFFTNYFKLENQLK
jgi:hypothetical protein